MVTVWCICLQTEYVKNDIETIEKSLKETLVPEVSSALYNHSNMKYANAFAPSLLTVLRFHEVSLMCFIWLLSR